MTRSQEILITESVSRAVCVYVEGLVKHSSRLEISQEAMQKLNFFFLFSLSQFFFFVLIGVLMLHLFRIFWKLQTALFFYFKLKDSLSLVIIIIIKIRVSLHLFVFSSNSSVIIIE